MIFVRTIVTFIFVVACGWPPPLLRESSSSRLTTPGPASPRFEIWIKPRPWKHRPSAATSRHSSLHRTACGRRINRIVSFVREGKRWYVHDLLKGTVLLAWEIRSAVRIYRASLLCDYRRTGIFFFRKLFFRFFLSRTFCVPPSEREMYYQVLIYSLHLQSVLWVSKSSLADFKIASDFTFVGEILTLSNSLRPPLSPTHPLSHFFWPACA